MTMLTGIFTTNFIQGDRERAEKNCDKNGNVMERPTGK